MKQLRQIKSESGVVLLYSDTGRFGSTSSGTIVSKAHGCAETIALVAFDNIRFEAGNFDSAQFVRSSFSSIDFEGTWLSEAVFDDCVFSKVLFYEIQAFRTRWVGGSLRDVQFEGANLAEARFDGTAMQNVIFTHDQLGLSTDIRGADLSAVDLSSAKFVSATFDDRTRFPIGFVPNECAGLQRGGK